MQKRKSIRIVWQQGALLFALCAGPAAAAEKPIALPKDAVPVPMTLFNFDHDIPGKPPAHFTLVVGGAGPNIHWQVLDDPHAPSRPYVLAQDGKAEPGDNFALAILDEPVLDHGEAVVRFKVMGGEDDQGAGIVWRWKDPQTYYVVRASAREDSCAVYRIKKGKVKLLSEQLVIVSPYLWHDLRVIFVNKNFSAFFDGELVLGGKDSGILSAGQVGLWTKGDSSVRFDDFRVSK